MGKGSITDQPQQDEIGAPTSLMQRQCSQRIDLMDTIESNDGPLPQVEESGPAEQYFGFKETLRLEGDSSKGPLETLRRDEGSKGSIKESRSGHRFSLGVIRCGKPISDKSSLHQLMTPLPTQKKKVAPAQSQDPKISYGHSGTGKPGLNADIDTQGHSTTGLLRK